MSREQRAGGARMVAVAVREDHAAEAAALLHLCTHALHVRVEVGPRVDYVCGLTPYEVGVRARKRKSAGANFCQ